MKTNTGRLGGLVHERRGRFRVTKPAVFATLALLSGCLMIVSAAPAQAAYPGDNGRIVFVGDDGHGTWDVITMDADGTDRVNLTQGAFDAEHPAWSPDGTRIAFSTVVGSPSGCRTGDIYVMDADGSDMSPLTTNEFGVAAYDPTWSPDGSEIAFTREHWDSACNSGDVDIWKMNSDGSSQVLLTAGAHDFGPAHDSEPAWSPDGDRIAFRSDRDNADWAGNDQIYTMDPNGSNVIQVTHQDDRTFESNFSPAWSPDGEQIAYQHFPHRPPSGLGSAQIWRINEDGTGETAVTSNGIFNMNPAWSPDGQRILFTTHFEDPPGDFNNDIFAINPDGTDQTNITNTGAAKDQADWQPIVQPPAPGGKIAWVTAGPDGSFTEDIWTMDPDGSNKTNLLPGDTSEAFPEWSRDGTKIAFSRSGTFPSGCHFGDIFVMDADGSNVTQVTTSPPGSAAFDPTWSPDGQQIAFTRIQQDPTTCSGGGVDIWVTDVDGTNQVALTTGGTDDEPAWSPDGTKIAFRGVHENEEGNRYPEIYTMDADGSNVTRLTDTEFLDPESNDNPTWSPDGTKIAFEHIFFLSTYSEIWIMDADGSNETPVAQSGSSDNIDPAWSPDGTKIAFSGLGPGGSNNEIYTIDVDGSDQRQITDNDVVDWMPTWQPVIEDSPPAPPTFTSTDPVSPADDNNPRIIGSAAGAVTVTLYETADCSGPAAAHGTAAAFTSPGLPVTVPDNSTTTFHGTATDAAGNVSACSSASITFVEDSAPADLVVTDCADPALAELTSVEGDLIVEEVPGCQTISFPALTHVGGLFITGNTTLESVDLTSLATVAGDLTVVGNGSGDLVLETVEVSGNLTFVGNGSGDLVLEAVEVSGNLTVVDNASGDLVLETAAVAGDLTVTGNGSATVSVTDDGTVGGDLTVVENGSATVNLGAGAAVGGDLTVVDNGSATVNIEENCTVAGNVTIEGQGAGEVQLPTTTGDLTLDTSGYEVISGATASGTTSISNTHGQAVMRVVLPQGTFETPVAFTITMREPATLLPEEGTGADGGAATVDPMVAYDFEFAVPVLDVDATLSFDVLPAELDAATQAALFAALDAGTATLVTRGGAAGDSYQAFPLCSGGAAPTVDGCVLVERLDADGQPTTGPPAMVRFTGVTGHFSTWGVAIIEQPPPPPDPRTQIADLRRDVQTSPIQAGLRLDLVNKLDAALKALAKSPPGVVLACEKVAEFARKVKLEASKDAPKIPAAAAARWLEAAAAIRSGLGC